MKNTMNLASKYYKLYITLIIKLSYSKILQTLKGSRTPFDSKYPFLSKRPRKFPRRNDSSV